MLSLQITGKGVIANADAISDTAGGTWSEQGGGTIAVSNDVFLIGSGCMGGKYASKSGFHQYDLGSGSELDFTASTGSEAGQLIYIWVSMTALGTLDVLSTYPLCVRISSDSPGTSNYVDYLIAGNDDKNGWSGGFKCFVIDPTKTGSRVSGTQSSIIASVRTLGIWIDCSTSARADSIFVDQIAVGSGLSITGTSTTGWKDAVDYCTAYASRGWGMLQEREGIYYAYGKMKIGPGTAANVSFADSGRVMQFGVSEYCTNAATGVWASSVPDNFSGVVIEDHASYSTTFSDGVIVGTAAGRSGTSFIGNSSMSASMDLYGGSNAASVTTLYGTSLKTITGAINAGNDADHKFLSVSMAGCGQFDPVGAPVIRNCTFAETADVDASLLWNENIDIQDCNFIANTLGASIEMPSAAGSPYDYDDLMFSGNTYDVLNSSGSAITITKSDASNPSTSEGSAVTFSGSVSITITVKDTDGTVISGVQTAVYKTSDRTELMNEDTNASGIASEAYTGATPVEVEVRCRKGSSGATRYKSFSSVQTVATSTGLALAVTLEEDPYNNATT